MSFDTTTCTSWISSTACAGKPASSKLKPTTTLRVIPLKRPMNSIPSLARSHTAVLAFSDGNPGCNRLRPLEPTGLRSLFLHLGESHLIWNSVDHSAAASGTSTFQ